MLRWTALLAFLLTLLTVGPATAGVTGTVEPPTDLVDRQVVRLVVDGLPAQDGGSFVEIVQCRTPIVDRATDCAPYGPFRHVSPAGLLQTHVAVRTLLLVDGGNADCRVEACALRVAIDGGPDAAALVPLDFDPSGPIPDPPTVEASPTTDLVDGQRIALHGVGLFPFDDLTVRMCPEGHDDASCFRLVPVGSFADENGEYHAAIAAWAVLRPRGGPVTDCRTTACVLRAEVTFGLAAPVEIPLSFDPLGDLLVPQVVVAPHTDLGPRQAVTVRLVGFHSLPIGLDVHQCLGRPAARPDLRQCDRSRDETFAIGDDAVRVGTRRLLHTAGRGDVDCSVRRCHIWIGRTLEAPSLSSERLTFRPRR